MAREETALITDTELPRTNKESTLTNGLTSWLKYDKRLFKLIIASPSKLEFPQLNHKDEAKVETEKDTRDIVMQKDIKLKEQGWKQKMKGHLLMTPIYKRKDYSTFS